MLNASIRVHDKEVQSVDMAQPHRLMKMPMRGDIAAGTRFAKYGKIAQNWVLFTCEPTLA
jgi:hypothetical protein